MGEKAAYFHLGECYEQGEGVTADLNTALDYYQKAAEQEDEDAYCALGRFCENGILLPRDRGRAVEWYRKGAQAGSANALYQLARCYAEGLGCPQTGKRRSACAGKRWSTVRKKISAVRRKPCCKS